MGRIRELKDAVSGFFDDEVVQRVRDQTAMRLRSDPRILERWMGYCGVTEVQAIDYGNPCVFIEFMACDPTILGMASDREAFLAATGCDREVFTAHYWPGGPAAEP